MLMSQRRQDGMATDHSTSKGGIEVSTQNRFAGIQQLGRALMLPIAVLPVAGLLLRLGSRTCSISR
jgi:hypothetical protein